MYEAITKPTNMQRLKRCLLFSASILCVITLCVVFFPPRSSESLALSHDHDSPTAEVTPPAVRFTDALSRFASERHKYPIQEHSTEFSQGVRGRIVTDDWQPLPFAELWWIPTSPVELSRALALPIGPAVATLPITHVTSDAVGEFMLGVPCPGTHVDGDIWIISDRRVDHRISAMRVTQGRWSNIASVRLPATVTIEGSVTEDGDHGRPIVGASVSVRPTAQNYSVSFVPGREDGFTTFTDSAGHYLVEGAPVGNVRISATATGYECKIQHKLQLRRGEKERCDFRLAPGYDIAGHVIDRDKRPIACVLLNVTSMNASHNQHLLEARTGIDGSFMIRGARRGFYRITVKHQDYDTKELSNIAAPGSNVTIPLQRLATIHVQVNGHSGWMLSEYDVTLKAVVPGREDYAATLMPRLHLVTQPGEVGVIERIPPSQTRYVLQVEAEGHAHAYSETFAAGLDRDPLFLAVRLDHGGTVEGFVFDEEQQPVVGAAVITLPCEVGHSLFALSVASTLNSNITRKSVITDQNGRFILELLAPGNYFLNLSHRNFCSMTFRNIFLSPRHTIHVPDIHMRRGTIVSGKVLSDGRLDGMVRVGVSTILGPPSRDSQKVPDYGECLVRQDGTFRVPTRFPPGKYRVVVGRSTEPTPEPRITPMASLDIQLDGSKAEFAVDLPIPAK